jgi:hypothetical protein
VGRNRCTLCRMDYESSLHLFFHCSYAQQVWSIISTHFKINVGALTGRLEEWLYYWKNEKAQLNNSLLFHAFLFISYGG